VKLGIPFVSSGFPGCALSVFSLAGSFRDGELKQAAHGRYLTEKGFCDEEWGSELANRDSDRRIMAVG